MITRRTFLAQTALSAATLTATARAVAAVKVEALATADPTLLERARTLLEQAPLIDTHNDLPSMFIELNGGDLTRFDLTVRQPTLCADIPALREGRVGGQYWSIFVESKTQNAHVSLHEALREFDVALRFMHGYEGFEQARTADDIERIHAAGKIACLLGVEGGHMIENSPAVLRVFYQLGARYMTLTHWDNIDWADAATDRPEHYGLTDLGKDLVREMNRLGMFVDLSHVSADTMRDALRATRAPVIFSHSNAYAVDPHPRNVPDDVLRLVRDNGGVVHVNFIRSFVSPEGHAWDDKRAAALRDLRGRLADQASIDRAITDWERYRGFERL